MGANFYERFKNKEFMNLFKRLCTQNQQRKFDALWQVLDNMCAELLKEQASTSSRRHFTQWIKNAPKEKWSILYDTGGRRYGIETTMLQHGNASCLWISSCWHS